MTAYEELKAWCEKHLGENDYKVVEKTDSYLATIYFIDGQCDDASGMIYFFGSGEVAGISNYTEDEMIEHINEVECEEEKREKKEPLTYSPPPRSIGGMMVRKMIEEYERKQR
jgi:hypothetical protein